MITLNDHSLTKTIGGNNPCFIICEIGQNHNGDINIAKQLINECQKAGADCVKFQKTNINAKFTQTRLNMPYTSKNSYGETYGQHKEYLEFSDSEFRELQAYAHNLGIMFTASAMDLLSCNYLDKLNVPFIKIGSGDNTNLQIIKLASSTNKPVILSTGMCNMSDVTKSVNTFLQYNKQLCLLQCTSNYPCNPNDVNLNVMDTYKQTFNDVIIGYSNHSPNPVIMLGAVAKGAKIIEMHVTLDKTMKGSDHMASLNMIELKECIQNVRQIEHALGTGKKEFLECEQACFDKLGKWLVFRDDFEKGWIIREDDVLVKVTEKKGVKPNCVDKIVGLRLNRGVKRDEVVEMDCFEDKMVNLTT
jgi:sialic acid synthase